jgi:hypothetical protein
MKPITYISLPAAMTANMTEEQFLAFCAHFDCHPTLDRVESTWVIGTREPINLFWLGANLFTEPEQSVIATSVLAHIKRTVK